MNDLRDVPEPRKQGRFERLRRLLAGRRRRVTELHTYLDHDLDDVSDALFPKRKDDDDQ